MVIKIEPLNESLFPGLREFADEVWDFPPGDSFLRWFFFDTPNTLYMVAHKDGRWLAGLGIFMRRYLHADGPVDCGETYAWASLRNNESKGLGIKVMKAIMDRGLPLVALGGSQDTLNYMPRLGFEHVASAPVLNLPLATAAVERIPGIKGKLAKLGIQLLGPVLRPRPPGPCATRSVPISQLDRRTLEMLALSGFQPMYTPEFFRWLTDYPEAGTFLPFRFIREGELAGWAITRIAEDSPGLLVGRILELKFGLNTSASEQRVMVQSIAASLAGCGVAIIRTLATCPETIAALRSLHFVSQSTPNPALVFPAGRKFGQEPVRLSMIRADGGALPLPSRSQLACRMGA